MNLRDVRRRERGGIRKRVAIFVFGNRQTTRSGEKREERGILPVRRCQRCLPVRPLSHWEVWATDIAPGFDIRKDPGEEEAEPGDVGGVRLSHRAVVGISSGPGDMIVGPGGPEGLGGEVEDTVVEGEEVVVGVEAA